MGGAEPYKRCSTQSKKRINLVIVDLGVSVLQIVLAFVFSLIIAVYICTPKQTTIISIFYIVPCLSLSLYFYPYGIGRSVCEAVALLVVVALKLSHKQVAGPILTQQGNIHTKLKDIFTKKRLPLNSVTRRKFCHDDSIAASNIYQMCPIS